MEKRSSFITRVRLIQSKRPWKQSPSILHCHFQPAQKPWSVSRHLSEVNLNWFCFARKPVWYDCSFPICHLPKCLWGVILISLMQCGEFLSGWYFWFSDSIPNSRDSLSQETSNRAIILAFDAPGLLDMSHYSLSFLCPPSQWMPGTTTYHKVSS